MNELKIIIIINQSEKLTDMPTLSGSKQFFFAKIGATKGTANKASVPNSICGNGMGLATIHNTAATKTVCSKFTLFTI